MGFNSSIPDYYSLLGISVYASQDEIRRAFRRLAHRYHPDKLQEEATDPHRFNEILVAYQVLSDPGSRRKYNRSFYGNSLWEERLDADGLMEKIRLFQAQVRQADPFRYDEEALSYHFQQLLQWSEYLKQSGEINSDQSSSVVEALLPALERLPSREWRSAGNRLVNLSQDNQPLAAKIARQVKWLPFWRGNRWPVGIALLITLLLGGLLVWGVST